MSLNLNLNVQTSDRTRFPPVGHTHFMNGGAIEDENEPERHLGDILRESRETLGQHERVVEAGVGEELVPDRLQQLHTSVPPCHILPSMPWEGGGLQQRERSLLTAY